MQEFFDYALRSDTNAWGQSFLQGMNWDLLPYFFGAGVAFIVGHILYMWLWAHRVKEY